MQFKLALCALAVLATAACSKPGSEPSAPSSDANDVVAEGGDAASPDASGDDTAAGDGASEDLCHAADYQSLVGSSVAAVTLPAGLNHRIIGPNDVVTMDFNPERLNIYTDENGVVTEVKCG